MNQVMAQYNFADIYKEYKEYVWKLVSRYTNQKVDREDLFQEVFLKIYEALPGFREEAKLATWIYKIVVNTALNYLKRQKRYAGLKEILSRFRKSEAKEDNLGIQETSSLKYLEKLNPRQRMILTLADIEEKKLGEIAELLRLPLGTVKSNLNRAREIVKKELKKHGKI